MSSSFGSALPVGPTLLWRPRALHSPAWGPRATTLCSPPPWKLRQGNYFWNKSSYTTNELFIFGPGERHFAGLLNSLSGFGGTRLGVLPPVCVACLSCAQMVGELVCMCACVCAPACVHAMWFWLMWGVWSSCRLAGLDASVLGVSRGACVPVLTCSLLCLCPQPAPSPSQLSQASWETPLHILSPFSLI